MLTRQIKTQTETVSSAMLPTKAYELFTMIILIPVYWGSCLREKEENRSTDASFSLCVSVML